MTLPQQQTVTSQTVAFRGLPHRHGSQNQVVSVLRQPEQLIFAPVQQQQEVFVEEITETAVIVENGGNFSEAEVTRYTTIVEQDRSGQEVVTITKETEVFTQDGPEGLF